MIYRLIVDCTSCIAEAERDQDLVIGALVDSVSDNIALRRKLMFPFIEEILTLFLFDRGVHLI